MAPRTSGAGCPPGSHAARAAPAQAQRPLEAWGAGGWPPAVRAWHPLPCGRGIAGPRPKVGICNCPLPLRPVLSSHGEGGPAQPPPLPLGPPRPAASGHWPPGGLVRSGAVSIGRRCWRGSATASGC